MTVWERDEIDSPCTQVCQIHPDTGLCLGCARTGDEIAVWSTLTPEKRREIMAALPEREPAPTHRRGGRKRTRG